MLWGLKTAALTEGRRGLVDSSTDPIFDLRIEAGSKCILK
jgi:hypothetical protein